MVPKNRLYRQRAKKEKQKETTEASRWMGGATPNGKASPGRTISAKGTGKTLSDPAHSFIRACAAYSQVFAFWKALPF